MYLFIFIHYVLAFENHDHVYSFFILYILSYSQFLIPMWITVLRNANIYFINGLRRKTTIKITPW